MTHVATAPDDVIVDPDELAARRRSTEEQLPLFDGFRIRQLEIALAGGCVLGLTDEDHRKIRERLKLDARVTISVEIGPHRFDLDGYVQGKGQKHRKVDESRQLVETVRIQIDPAAAPDVE